MTIEKAAFCFIELNAVVTFGEFILIEDDIFVLLWWLFLFFLGRWANLDKFGLGYVGYLSFFLLLLALHFAFLAALAYLRTHLRFDVVNQHRIHMHATT